MLHLIGIIYCVYAFAKKAMEAKMNPILWGFIGLVLYTLSGMVAYFIFLQLISIAIDITKIDEVLKFIFIFIFTGIGIGVTVSLYELLSRIVEKKNIDRYIKLNKTEEIIKGKTYESKHIRINIFDQKIQRKGSQISGGASINIICEIASQRKIYLHHSEYLINNKIHLKEKYDDLIIELKINISTEKIIADLKFSGLINEEYEEELISLTTA